jgi:hypothetical protein
MAKDNEAFFSDSESPKDAGHKPPVRAGRFMPSKNKAAMNDWQRKKAILAKHSTFHRVMSQVLKARHQKKVEQRLREIVMTSSIKSQSSFESTDAFSRASSIKAGSSGQINVPPSFNESIARQYFQRQLHVWSQQQQEGHNLIRQFGNMRL